MLLQSVGTSKQFHPMIRQDANTALKFQRFVLIKMRIKRISTAWGYNEIPCKVIEFQLQTYGSIQT